MCLAALAIDQSRRFPLVIATNRDEYFHRPAARLGWWTPEGGGPAILGGRDLDAGGTWLGLTTAGRLALLTNVRNPARHEAEAPSRGRIVQQWLGSQESPDRFWMRTALSGYNGFNLIAADFKQGECFWASNHASHPQRLVSGLHGLSNALLDTPWPKVELLKTRLAHALDQASTVDELSALLFDALADRSPADDASLPSTGVPLAWERLLSSAFIRTGEGTDTVYGTRCSTLVIAEKQGRHLVTHVIERTFSATASMALLRRASLKNWPPRYGTEPSDEAPTTQEPVLDVPMPDSGPAPAVPVKRTRVRSLLKPALPRRRGE